MYGGWQTDETADLDAMGCDEIIDSGANQIVGSSDYNIDGSRRKSGTAFNGNGFNDVVWTKAYGEPIGFSLAYARGQTQQFGIFEALVRAIRKQH